MTGKVEVQEQQKAKEQEGVGSQENAEAAVEELKDPTVEEITTVKDMCRLVRTDIKNQALKKRLLELVYFCAGRALGAPEYRQIIQKAKDNEVVKKIHEIADRDKYRKEFVEMLTMYVNVKAKMPHYVILFGQNFDQAVKYSRGTLLQMVICKKYGLTMFEVPSIAINTISRRLTDEDLKPAKKQDADKMERLFKQIQMKELDHYSADQRIADRFKDLWPNAVQDTVKFTLCQSLLTKEKQSKEKLDALSSLVLSRVLKDVAEFQDHADTKELGTGFNWAVVLGESTQVQNQQYTVNTSHATMRDSTVAQILYYQKLECTYWSTNGQQKKFECVVYCQRVEHKSWTSADVVEGIKENLFSFDGMYYILFFTLLLGVIVGGKVCAGEGNATSPEDELRERGGITQPKSFTEQFCDERNRYTLNFGVLFLVMAAAKKLFGQKKGRRA